MTGPSAATGRRLPKIVAVVGTNASGKSELAVALAERFDGEIVSADSRQVYRGLDLAAGKVGSEVRARVPHHLIDVADLATRYTLADFQAAAYAAIDAVLGRSRLPVVVGGTGLYVQAIVDGYTLLDLPPDAELRAELESLGLAELRDHLESLDPAMAAEVDLDNRPRVVRAIEYARAGVSFAATRARDPHYEALLLGLTWPAPVLRERIEQRLRRRIAAGMVDEARAAVAAGASLDRLEELGLEYRHLALHLRGAAGDDADFEAALADDIWRFSRRQLKWFRRDGRVHWLDTDADFGAQAMELVEQFVAGA